MTSQLNVDTIVDKAGSGGTNVKIGNTSTYVSEGGAVTQNTVQGLVKCFSSLAHESGTPTAKDTLNVSSYSDSATGAVVVSYTNNMSVSIHCVTALANYRASSAQFKHISYNNNTAFTTASHELISGEGSFTLKDAENMSSIASGDLA